MGLSGKIFMGLFDINAGTSNLLIASVEIIIIAMAIYMVLKFIQSTRGAGVLKGLVIVFASAYLVLYFLATAFELEAIKWLLEKIIALSVLVLLIIFQPELRGGLVRLGQNTLFRTFVKTKISVIDEIIRAANILSSKKIGALIAIERDTGLGNYLEGGVLIDAEITSELLCTIFWPGAVLHDGAVIIQNNRVAGAGCLLPLSENPKIPKGMGTRHRAGIGLSEETDAVIVIVSEETGGISISFRGEIKTNITIDQLRQRIEELCLEHVQPGLDLPEHDDEKDVKR